MRIGSLIWAAAFSVTANPPTRGAPAPVAQTFPLAEVAEAHRVSQDGHVRGKLVLLVG
jgi:NADPH:quinone reductase-like Zn-dependent oxidoreductase